jgi:trimeric autotransporter adhesin
MSRYAIKFPFRVRIHGGEFDESARAIHREDGLKTIQADSGIVLESTIERKQMSTKTTFKRIALVAVAALGFGMLSVAPSTAVPQVDTLTASALTASAVPGAAASVTLTHTYLSTGTSDTVTATVSIVSMPAGNTVLPVLASVTTNDTGSPSKSVSGLTASTGSVAASTAVRGDYTLSLTTLTTGTYVFSVTPQAGSKASALTLTYTIADTAAKATAASSRVYMRAGALTAAGVGDASSPALLLDGGNYEQTAKIESNGTVSYTQAALLTALGAKIATEDANTSNVTTLSVTGGATTLGSTVASFGVILGNGDTITASTISGAVQKNYGDYAPMAGYYFNAPGHPVTVTVTGPGSITHQGVVKGKTFTEANTDANYLQKSFSLVSDGTLGTSTITFTSGGVTLATRTVNFVGPATTITPTVVNSVLKIGVNTGAVTAVVTDANGTPVSGVTVYAISGTDATIDSDAYQSCGSSSATGAVSCNLTGVAAGTATITLSLNATSAGTSTVSALAGTMRVSSGTPTKVDYKFEKETYAPGETAKITATVSDAVGVLPADTYTVLTTALSANYAISGLPTALTVAALASTGTATYTVTIPTGVSGALALTGTAVSTVTATYGSTTVVNAAVDAATAAEDAAIEAGDNANNAKDAADQALEAADRAELAAIEAGELAVAAAEEAGLIAQDALEAANEATDAALAAGEAAADATAAAVEAKDSADAATAAVAALATQVSALMAALNAKITTLSNLVAKIAKKVKA